MPRPRVPPSQRQRASEACNFCREAKKRCSGSAPCTHCLRRGIGHSCFISNQSRRHRNAPAASHGSLSSSVPKPTTSPSRDSHQTPPLLRSLGRESSPPNDVTPVSRPADFCPISPSESRTTELDGSARANSDAQAQNSHPVPRPGDSPRSGKPSSRMLLNLRGERGTLVTPTPCLYKTHITDQPVVYIGRGASLSFLQLVRSIVSEQIGPSQFSRNGKSDTMLEKESPQSHTHTPSIGGLSPEARSMCGDYFYAVVSYSTLCAARPSSC